MAKDFKIKATITAEDQASGTVSKIERSFASLGTTIKTGLLVSLAAVGTAFTAATGFLLQSTKASAEAEDGIKKLGNALADLGPKSGAVRDALVAQAEALQKVTKYEDDAIIAGQAFAAGFIKSEEGLKRVTQAAVDLAAGLGIELQTSFELLTKASQGSTAALGRYGLVLDESLAPAQKFAALQQLIAERFGGRAVADVDTYAGAIAQLRNSYDDLQEAAGGAITENEGVRKAIQELNATLRDEGTIDNVEALSAGLVKLGSGAVSGTVSVLSTIVDLYRGMGGDTDAVLRSLLLLNDKFLLVNGTSRETIEQQLALIETFKKLREEQERAAESTEKAAAAQAAANAADKVYQQNLRTLTAIYGDAAKATNALNEAREREKRIAEDAAAAENEIGEAAKRLGVVLEANVLNAINENNQAYERLRSSGLATAQTLDVLKQKNLELWAAIDPQAAKLLETQKAMESGERSAQTYGDTLAKTLVPALREVTLEAGRTTQSLQAIVDRSGAAITGVKSLSLGGTRANLVGGGSRLVGSTGGTFGAQQRSTTTGTKTYIYNPQSGRVEQYG